MLPFGTPMTITFAMVSAEVVALAHIQTNLPQMTLQVVTVAKIIVFTALESPRINPRIFYFCLKKHLTSAPGCGIIIVGRAGPGRRPGTEFPIGTPYGKISREKVALSYAPGFPGNPVYPIGPHICAVSAQKIGFNLPREQIKTPLHMPLACL